MYDLAEVRLAHITRNINFSTQRKPGLKLPSEQSPLHSLCYTWKFQLPQRGSGVPSLFPHYTCLHTGITITSEGFLVCPEAEKPAQSASSRQLYVLILALSPGFSLEFDGSFQSRGWTGTADMEASSHSSFRNVLTLLNCARKPQLSVRGVKKKKKKKQNYLSLFVTNG